VANPKDKKPAKATEITPDQAAERKPGFVTMTCCQDHKGGKGMVSWNVRRGEADPGCPGEHFGGF
jgi:hypothetical protein